MKIKRKIKFELIKLKGKTKDLRIRMRVSYIGERIEIPLTCRVDIEKWDAENQYCLPGHEDKFGNKSKNINNDIEKHREMIEKVFTKYELFEQRIPSPDELKKEFNILMKKKQLKNNQISDVHDLAKIFLREQRSFWSEGTYRRVKNSLSHLKKFKSKISTNELNESFIKSYAIFLNKNQNLQNSTTLKNISHIRQLAGWINKKYKTNIDTDDLKIKLKVIDSSIEFLNWDELMLIYNMEFQENKKYLEKTRDVFCFCCFTSLRHSDVYDLKRSDITDKTITIVTVKTADPIVIDLNNYSKAILKKYEDIKFKENKALPVISSQKMNDYLKEIAKIAELNTPRTIVYYKGNERIAEVVPRYELITSHCGRRTFICNALILGIPPHVVMKWTGHEDYESMKPYINVADKAKTEMMKKFNI